MTMTTATTRTLTPLRDALYELALAKPIPDADLLEEFVRRYPDHAEALTQFAIELVVDAASDSEDTMTEPAGATVSPVVARAMSMFQNHLFAAEDGDTNATAPQARHQSSNVQNPFSTLDNMAFRGFATRLNANTVFVIKLRDRQIEPDTMTDGFRRRIADELRVPVEVVAAHLAAAPELSARPQFYKADQKPEVSARQSFEDAVKSSGLTEEQQRYLMTI